MASIPLAWDRAPVAPCSDTQGVLQLKLLALLPRSEQSRLGSASKKRKKQLESYWQVKTPTFCAGQDACFPLALQACSCRSKSSCFLFLPAQGKFARRGVSTELILPSFFFLLFLHPVLKQALQQTGTPIIPGGASNLCVHQALGSQESLQTSEISTQP